MLHLLFLLLALGYCCVNCSVAIFAVCSAVSDFALVFEYCVCLWLYALLTWCKICFDCLDVLFVEGLMLACYSLLSVYLC